MAKGEAMFPKKAKTPPCEACGDNSHPRKVWRGKTLCPPCRRTQVKQARADGLIPDEECYRYTCKLPLCGKENLYPLALLEGRTPPLFCGGSCRSKYHCSAKAQRQRRDSAAVIPSVPATKVSRPVLRDREGFSNFRKRNCDQGKLCRHYIAECFAGVDFRPRNLKGGCYEEPEESTLPCRQAINIEARSGGGVGRWNKCQMAR